ncbi:MAG: non-canonical purine NTP pyrophosphatase [Pseudomonadota bacterium]
MGQARISLGDRLLVASHNPKKLAEFIELLSPLGVEVVGAGAMGLAEPDETEHTFEGNAAIKAEAACAATGLPALSDDSGIVVDGLGGAPGVYSADWAGPGKDFAPAMARVLTELGEKGCHTPEARTARFVSVLALARPGEPTVFFRGETEGVINDGPRGSGGMGYDPIFVPVDGDGRTFAEMTTAEKAGLSAPLSHRARALAALLAAITPEAAA